MIPKFQTSGVVKTLSHSVSRNLYQLSHCLFRTRLEQKCQELNVALIFVKEDYTTKTCSNCGNLQNIGISREYNCEKCKAVLYRDSNAAKNILLKNLNEC